MPDLTTRDALLEKMVEETGKLKENIPAALEKYLPLSGGTMSGTITEEMETPATRSSLIVKYTDITNGTAPSVIKAGYTIRYQDKDNTYLGGVYNFVDTDGSAGMSIYARWGSNNKAVTIQNNGSSVTWRPSSNNTHDLGGASFLWKEIYASTATINTSDERLKDNISAIPERVLDAWGEVGWYQFQFKDSIAEKGENARFHTGAIAQRIKEVFESHDLDAFRYGLLCYDEWDAEEKIKDEQGNVIQEGREAGNLYSLRYEEALCMEAAYQRRRADQLEKRIEALESKGTRKKK